MCVLAASLLTGCGKSIEEVKDTQATGTNETSTEDSTETATNVDKTPHLS